MFLNKQQRISFLDLPICLSEIITLMFSEMFCLLQSSVDDTFKFPLGKIISLLQICCSEYEVWKTCNID